MPQANKKPSERWASFSGEQKFGLVVFSITGTVGLVLSVLFLLQQIRAPFQLDYDGEVFLSSAERELQEVEKQKTADTDTDGISDYDELNVYRTSAYLADSDGDGFSDGQEINSGNDPNCPAGQSCGRGQDAGVNSAVRASDLSDKVPFEDAGLAGSVETAGDLKVYLSSLTTEQIREALLQAGVSEETLSGMDDEALRALFDDALKELDSEGAFEGGAETP